MIDPNSKSIISPSKVKPVLFLEVCTKGEVFALEEEITTWLRDNYLTLQLKQTIKDFSGLQSSEQCEFLQVADITTTTTEEPCISLADVQIAVQTFQLHRADKRTSLLARLNGSSEEVELPQAKVTALPNDELDGIWDSLVFDDPIQTKLLNFIIRMVAFSARQIRSKTLSWNRLLLLYGPPGTGKTSLCRALAQKLSIRLGRQYSQCKMVEIDSHALFSKYFSESGKLVGKMFDAIEAMLDEEKETFVCVLMDEIESLTSARELNLGGNEPRDALRAVNALLTALDRLRSRPNVVVLCTSNLIKAMDAAFLDRVDIKQYIPEPCARARYEIYRLSYLELARCGIIAPILRCDDHDDASMVDEEVHGELSGMVRLESQWQVFDNDLLPAYDLMQLHYWPVLDSPPRMLWDLAEKSTNLSGRTLRRLPALALALHTDSDPCSFDEALKALSRSVEEQLLAKT